jgi:hypothetical protein
MIAPHDPRVPIALAMIQFRTGSGMVRPQVQQAAMDALDQDPLADEPFFLAGVAALVAGDEAKAQQLLREAQRRNPRSRYPRLILLDRYLRTNRIDEATVEMGVLGNLISGASGLLVPELGRLAQARETGPALERALRKNPELRDDLLEYLVRSGADLNLILRLSHNVPAPRSRNASRPWRAMLIESLVARGQTERAYTLWRTFSAPRAPARKVGVYDSELHGLPGLPPFNWYFPETAAGAVERSPTGLQVEFYGRDPAELASQLLMLPSGRFRLSFIAEGAADGESSRISWKLQCLASKAELGELPLSKVGYSPRRYVGEFIVPAQGCPAQSLKLVGVPAEFTKPQHATIRGIQLTVVR